MSFSFAKYNHQLSSLQKQKSRVWEAFWLGLLVGGAALLPYVIFHKGLFFYYGDFNVQQIPFYQLANEAVRSGNIWWSWKTDLGANFLGSYSFYLLFSPFFWVSLLFPTAATPYLMAPLLALKSGCAAATAYLYLRRFVRDQEYAVLCSLLYAFSGFAVYNIFFNHFHEAIVFFPLLLIGLEEAMTENRWGRFALAIMVNAMVNYWFFIGEVVFVALYFLVRLSSPQWRLTPRKFISLACEAVLGLGLAMVAFLPSVLAIMGNPRTTSGNILLGKDLWYYSNPQRYLGILHSIFFSPDMPAINSWFPDHGAKWSSLSAYLPLFSVAGVIAYIRARKKDWLGTLILASGVFAMVPMLNHLFVGLNYSYYARWFYMPTLLMVLATALALENCGRDGNVDIWKGIYPTAGVMLLLLVMVGLTPYREDDKWMLGTYREAAPFLATAAITLLGFVAAVWLLRRRNSPRFKSMLASVVIIGCFLYTFSCLLIGKVTYPNNDWITDVALPGRDNMSLDAPGEFARSDLYKADDNLGMYWNLPNIQTFHSVVPVSIMEFYPEVGVKRDVSSKPDLQENILRPLLSVRWLYVKESQEEQEEILDAQGNVVGYELSLVSGYTYRETRLGYNIYEYDHFLPMGFAYDNYFTQKQWDDLDESRRLRSTIYALTLEDDAVIRHQDILEPVSENWQEAIGGDRDMEEDVADRRVQSCYDFKIDNKGFTARSNLPDEELIFFSVPYDKGWKATVNGYKVRVEKANVGFIAVRVPAGESVIRLEYTPPGLVVGAVVTGLSVLLALLYLWVQRRFRAETVENHWEQTCIQGFDDQIWD